MEPDENDDLKEKHHKLAGVVKGVHAKLRRKYRNSPGEYDKVWQQHCNDTEVLSEYADAMHHLAVDIWTKHPETRIHWCRNACLDYFHQGGLKKALDKEERRHMFHGKHTAGATAEGVTSTSPSEGERGSSTSSTGQVSPGRMEASLRVIKSAPTNSNPAPIALSHSVGDHGGSVPGICEALHSDVQYCLQVQENREPSRTCYSSGSDVGAVSESEMIFGLPEGSFETPSTKILSQYQPVLYNTISLPLESKIRLLDVGSCYNPFSEFDEFLSIGVDISPAVESVYHCDFLSLETQEPLQLAEDSIGTYVHNLKSPVLKLPRETFHVVVFSLLLEYFPSPYQRWLCCQKAHELLMVNGLLLIINPDSHGQHRNAPMMKSWKLAIESMGFRRWKYVKLEHLHCMAFRRVVKEETDVLVTDVSPDMMFIPQDFHDMEEDAAAINDSGYFFGSLPRSLEEDSFILQAFQELPDSLE